MPPARALLLLILVIPLGACASPQGDATGAARRGALGRTWTGAPVGEGLVTTPEEQAFQTEVRTLRTLLDHTRNPRAARQVLPEALLAPSEVVRDLACLVLVRLEAIELVPVLLASATAYRPARPQAPSEARDLLPASTAIAALAALGPRASAAIDGLDRLLDREGSWLFPWALPALTSIDQDARTWRHHLDAAMDSDDPFVRRTAEQALRRLETP